jgi:succinyl-CoA synthetase beta subunit
MHLHEYQAKEVLRAYGISIPPFAIISNLDEAVEAFKTMGLSQAVIKVQVHAGGRGKAGGVKIAKTPDEILKTLKALLGMKITNNQTGKEGIIAHKVLISPLVNYQKEYYLGAVIDRKYGQSFLIASPEGGVDIEEVAAHHPEKILTLPISSRGTLRPYQLIEVAKFMGWEGSVAEQGKKTVAALAKAFVETDATLLEINPLVQTTDGDIVALDAKMTLDDNALYRQKALAAQDDPTQVSLGEARAKEHELAYVSLEGDIGCMVNGAGLAMATMDIIQYYGGTPANFLDVGGGATEDKVAEGFKILLSDHKVKSILVNIFGGIMNCATLAAGIVAATTQLKVSVPLIVRMEGTNVEKGKQILKDSGLQILIAGSLADAAQKAVAAAH